MTLDDDYRALRERAGIGAVSARQQLAVAGPDRASYLQGLLTNDIQRLTPGTGCYAAWLSPQGRMLTDMHVLESGGMILLDVPQGTAAATLARLDQFLFSEDVRLESMADSLAGVWIHGPAAAAVLETVLRGASELGEWPDYRHAQFEFEGEPVSVARIDQLGEPGYCVYAAKSGADRLASSLERAGATRLSQEAIEAARIEAGYPLFGVDMTEDTIPLEAGIENRAISFTKGCYVGQEIIIRVLHRGGGRVARKLVGVQISAGPADAGLRDTGHDVRSQADPVHHLRADLEGSVRLQADPGAKIYSGDREIGRVTSAAVSPSLGSIALAYVHRDFVAPATRVDVIVAGGRRSAFVTEHPMRPAA